MLLAMMMVGVLFAAEPQLAETTAPVQQELKPGERRVKMKCKTEAVNGSRVLKRRCMTLDEWKRMEEESAKSFQEMQSRSPLVPTCQQSAMRSC